MRSTCKSAASLAFATSMVGLLLAAAPAVASERYRAIGSFSGAGSADGQMNRPKRAAVQAATGNVYIVDSENDRVQIFRPNATGAAYLTQFGAGTLDSPFGIALDQRTGDVYVSDAGNNRIVRFESDGATTPSFTLDPSYTSPAQGTGTGEIGSFAADIELAPGGDLLVGDPGDNLVQRYDSSGFVDDFDGSSSPDGAFRGLLDIAVDSSGDIIVVDSEGDIIGGARSRVERFDSTGGHEATIGPVASPGMVAVDPRTDDVLIGGNFESYWNEQPLHVFVYDDANAPIVDFDVPGDTTYGVITGLAQDAGNRGRLYIVTDADPYDGSWGNVTVQVMEPPQPPAATTLGAETTESTARMFGRVNPQELATTYWFEYGSSPAYGTSVPAGQDADAGAGSRSLEVNRLLINLQPGVTYHYRIVATNAAGTKYGSDRTFTVSGAVTPPPTGGLPDGRGYEVVSPGAGKKTGELSLNFVQLSADGTKAIYHANNPFGDASHGLGGLGNSLAYRAVRTSSGWSSTFVSDAPPPPTALQRTSFYPVQQGASLDLSQSIFSVNYYGTPGFTTGLWIRGANGPATVLAAKPDSTREFPQPMASSFDGSRVLVASAAPLQAIPGNPVVGNTLWDVSNAAMKLVNVDDQGEPLHSTGAIFASGGGPPGSGQKSTLRNAMSQDGSRIFFYSREPGAGDFDPQQLYVRIDGARTIEVSASQRTVPLPLEDARFAGASADGTRAYFASTGQLTDDARGSGPFLYEYHLPRGATSGQLTLVAGNQHPVVLTTRDVSNTVQALVSDDGSRVYYFSDDDGGSVFAYDTAARSTRLVADGVGLARLATVLLVPGVTSVAETTPDGRYLAFPSSAEGVLGPEDTGTGQKIYRYDSVTGDLRLVSTSPTAPPVSFDSVFRSGNMGPTSMPLDPNSISDDGKYVFFETRAKLVPQDTNARVDVYRWRDDGDVALVTDGTSGSDFALAGASADGTSVFFLTLTSLVPQDGDGFYDLYVARVGGGFPVDAPPVPCNGDACQGPLGTPPATPEPQTDTFVGPGNIEDRDPPEPRTPRVGKPKVNAAQKRALVRSGRVTLAVNSTARGTVTAQLRVRVGRRWKLVDTARSRMTGPGTARLRLQLSRAMRARLAQSGALRVRIDVSHSESADDQRTGFVVRTARGSRASRSAATDGGKR